MIVNGRVKASRVEGEEYERGDHLDPVTEYYSENKLQYKGPDNREHPEIFILIDLFMVRGLDR